VYIDAPPKGTWKVEEIPGQPLAEVVTADDAPTSVSAKVAGKGEGRTIRWNVGDLEGGRLQLSEVQPGGKTSVLVDTAKRTGSAKFLVPFGKAGKRRLVGVVSGADGIPQAQIAAGDYVAPKPFVPSAPKDVKVSFNRRSRIITFSVVPPANPDLRPDFWFYKVSLADGRVLYLSGAGGKKIQVRDVAPGTGFVVSAVGVEREGIKGRARVERGKA
jgi:hypothetical protein